MFIEHPTKIVNGIVEVPSSKSISNRALVLQHLLGSENILLSNLSEANDTKVLQHCLQQINFHQKKPSNSNLFQTIDAANAGTAYRFLTSLLAITKGNWILSGDERMQERPIKSLVDALNNLGADVQYLNQQGFPPLKIIGKKLFGGKISMSSQQSSQFVSSLLLIAPTFEKGLQLELEDNPVSESYIHSTIDLMKEFGIICSKNGNLIQVDVTEKLTTDYVVEPDWSSIAFFAEIAALANEAKIVIKNVVEKSIQGDSIISKIAKDFSVDFSFVENDLVIEKKKISNVYFYEKKLHFNFRSTPDLTQAIAATSAGLLINSTFEGIEHLALKETDRLKALKNELQKIESHFEKVCNFFLLRNEKSGMKNHSLLFKTYNDHRMAMAFAPLCLKFGKVEIENKNAVTKSFPNYWNRKQL